MKERKKVKAFSISGVILHLILYSLTIGILWGNLEILEINTMILYTSLGLFAIITYFIFLPFNIPHIIELQVRG